MLGLGKILLPVDFSERAVGAAQYAKTLARHCHSEVTMLHVVKPIAYAMDGGAMAEAASSGWFADWLADSRRSLEHFQADEFEGIPVTRALVEGDPAKEIIKYAHDIHAGLIVLPTHGYGPFRRFILGSVTAKVLHDADCPVFTGAHLAESPEDDAISFGNILCAIDLGPQSHKTLCWAARLASEFDGRLTVVHALPSLDVGEARYFDQSIHVMIERQASEQLQALQDKVGTHAEVIFDYGDVAKVVSAAAGTSKADLVVIGRHAAAGIIGRLRTHGYAIVRESPCPVVSV